MSITLAAIASFIAGSLTLFTALLSGIFYERYGNTKEAKDEKYSYYAFCAALLFLGITIVLGVIY